ncbi:hypothetical protein QYE77_08950 [Thermanaerothrix sp. 4228-RoL]|uniref:Polymerase nucleotidyl transferase domain-containing protein n=1 Tax=Thermanaerothrix solaris TaxID=3058434 RepID=A0ABU3NNG0_9CHLR|nr:hypothetical protein [Thermanaerothrix sp. 4228-RoL]MDT8898393.1 hypothetical protein [Thermanaerothrix sp. 4228-RoL]
MRITREMLLNLARETAERTVRRQRDVLCIFLIGSVLDEEPLLGGSGDIDLVIVHDSEPLNPREVQRLSDEITLDIARLGAAAFQPARRLRQDPWLGSALWYNPLVLYDRQHWFEFTQAGATAQFTLPENVYPRAQRLAATARQIWRDLIETPAPALETAWRLLEALTQAANAIACLNGAPLTERRFVLNFPARAQAVGRPGLAAGFSDLIGGEAAAREGLQTWRNAWLEALEAVASREDAPPRLNAARRAYYQRPVEALAAEQPLAAWWIQWRTWTRAMRHLGETSPAYADWHEASEALGLGLSQRERHLAALDAYLDTVEETLDQWATANGVRI